MLENLSNIPSTLRPLMPMTKKQARALVKGVKDPEIIAAWKEKLGGSPTMEPEETDDRQYIRSLQEDEETW